jgi:Ca2+-binding RTX toxin-like protein
MSGKYGYDILSRGKGNDEFDGDSGVDQLDGGKEKDLSTQSETFLIKED